MNGAIELGWPALAGAAALLAVDGAVSAWLGLGLGRKLLVAAVRSVVQLSLLGLILGAIFDLGHPAPVALLGVGMIVLAGRAALGRTTRRYDGVGLHGIATLGLSTGATAVLATGVLIDVDPWWEPQYLIPLLGMLLGNCLTGISLGLDRILAELDEGAERIEVALALGATTWEAARPVASEAVRTGLIPLLNTMSVVGLITIPGMMTGQILAGADPSGAARYQILILFLIAAATGLGTTGAVLLAIRASFDGRGRLRRERIHAV